MRQRNAPASLDRNVSNSGTCTVSCLYRALTAKRHKTCTNWNRNENKIENERRRKEEVEEEEGRKIRLVETIWWAMSSYFVKARKCPYDKSTEGNETVQDKELRVLPAIHQPKQLWSLCAILCQGKRSLHRLEKR